MSNATSPAEPLIIPMGTSFALSLPVTDLGDLTVTAASATLELRSDVSDALPFATAAATLLSNAVAFAFSPAATAAMPRGRARFHVLITMANGDKWLLAYGVANIEKD